MRPNFWYSPIKASVRQTHIALASRTSLRQRIQVKRPLAILFSVMAGILIIKPQALAHSKWILNSSQPVDRPELPNRGIPTERKPTVVLTPCKELVISSAPQALAQVQVRPNLSQRVDRPELPNRGMPTERKRSRPGVSVWMLRVC